MTNKIMETNVEKGTNRLLALEGLRGLAAIGVVVYHTSLIFYPALFYGLHTGYASGLNSRFEGMLYGSPALAFISGTFAVGIFFVLSGFVLSVGFFQKKDNLIVRKLAAKRYIRLMLPALAATMLAWLLLTLGFSHTAQAQAITHSGWLALLWNFSPNFFDAIQQGMWGIFATGQDYYDPVLWTMLYEFAGSFIVFMTLLLFGKLKKRWLVYIALVIMMYQTWYLGFIFGLILADLYAHKMFPFNKGQGKFMVFCLIAGLILGGYSLGDTTGTFYQTISIPWLTTNQPLYMAVGAALVVSSILSIERLNKFFSHRRISILGKYTFSLYLTHKLVLFTFCTGLFVWLNTFLGFNKSAVIAVAASIPLIILSTYLFEKYVDSPSIRVSGVFANWLLGLPQKEGVTAYSEPKPTWTSLRLASLRARLRDLGGKLSRRKLVAQQGETE